MTVEQNAPRPRWVPDIDLGFEQTVPRALAHRSAIGEVFVADSAQVGADDFYLSFQIPRAHSLWADQAGAYHDPFASGEAARQSVFVVLHRHVGVPLGLPFSLKRFTFRIQDMEAYRNDETSSLQGTVHYRVTGRRHRDSDLVGMSLEGEVEIGGRPAMTLGTQIVFLPRSDYDVTRAFQRARKPLDSARLSAAWLLDPEQVGRTNCRNVVIGEAAHTAGARPEAGESRFLLVPDKRHPSFFDHGYDHVPEPLIIEGFRQVAIAAAWRSGAVPSPLATVVACEASFLDFGEFEADLVYWAKVGAVSEDGRVAVDMGLHQFGRRMVEGRIELLPHP